jgi:cyclopropane fatty-acyl-phospholipid synthase-like methyltransferase
MPRRFDAADIRSYYDRHTASFVRFGQGGGSIHRAVWGPGTTTRDQAFHFVDDQMAALVRSLPSPQTPHVVDLGCGVGASLIYLAARVPMRGTGITLSPVQAVIAQQAIAVAGLAARVTCFEGDYCDLPSTLASADLAYAIESFVHGPSPGRFFAQCGRLLKPGGLLVICDDVKRPASSLEAARAIEQFRNGWHVNALLERAEIVALAGASGFTHESTTDLTPLLEIRRARDRAIGALLALAPWLPNVTSRLDPVIGGHALQTCLAEGWIGYDVIVFRKT